MSVTKIELCANARCSKIVVMKPSIDDRYLVGICKKCGTKVIERKIGEKNGKDKSENA